MRPAPSPVVRGVSPPLLRLGCLLFAVCCLAVGCAAPANREALAQEVLKADPSFGDVLDKHREIIARVETYERELALKRSTIERSIAQLRKDLAAALASVRQKTAEAKKRMEPDRARLTLAISMASEELNAQRLRRASLARQIGQLRKSLARSDATWTPDERARRVAQIDEMVKETKRIDQELVSLRQHLRLLKIKLLLIKL